MSYMNNDAFAPTYGIHELSFDEVDYVAGGAGPLAPALVIGVACAKNTTCRNTVKGAAVAVAGAVAAFFGYENNRV